MPHAKLPTTLKGWLVALVGALVGLLAGFLTVNWLSGVVK
jgi:hypothetical protein